MSIWTDQHRGLAGGAESGDSGGLSLAPESSHDTQARHITELTAHVHNRETTNPTIMTARSLLHAQRPDATSVSLPPHVGPPAKDYLNSDENPGIVDTALDHRKSSA